MKSAENVYTDVKALYLNLSIQSSVRLETASSLICHSIFFFVDIISIQKAVRLNMFTFSFMRKFIPCCC